MIVVCVYEMDLWIWEGKHANSKAEKKEIKNKLFPVFEWQWNADKF